MHGHERGLHLGADQGVQDARRQGLQGVILQDEGKVPAEQLGLLVDGPLLRVPRG